MPTFEVVGVGSGAVPIFGTPTASTIPPTSGGTVLGTATASITGSGASGDPVIIVLGVPGGVKGDTGPAGPQAVSTDGGNLTTLGGDGRVYTPMPPRAAPTTNLSASTTNAEGSGSSVARNDHTHAITANVAPSALNSSAVVGTSAALARADHRHVFPTAANVGADPAGTASSAVSAHTAAHAPSNAINSTTHATIDHTSIPGIPITIADGGPVPGGTPVGTIIVRYTTP